MRSLGVGAGAWVWPGGTHAVVPAVKQEACFEMTQESKDGIPLRFKGVAVYRVIDPVAAAKAFDFPSGEGARRVGEILSHVCLGELRDLVARLSMRECIEQRKTVLSESVTAALERVLAGAAPEGTWGLSLEILQIAQVFIVDGELRAALEAELRHEIVGRSQTSDIETREAVERARLASARRLQAETLESTRQQHRVEKESLRSRQELDLERATLEGDLALARSERDAAVAERALTLERRRADLALDVARRARERETVEAEAALAPDVARQALEERMLPLRQVPEVARALSQALQGADLTIYGAEPALAAAVGPLLDRLARAMAVPSPGTAGKVP